MRNATTGAGPFTAYIRVKVGGSGTVFSNDSFQINVSGTAVTAAGLIGVGVAGKIQHLVLVREAGGAATFYLDGTVVATGTFGSTLSTSYEIGPYLGRVYRTCFWNRALTVAEVTSLPSHGPADQDRWGPPGCVLDIDFGFGIGRYLPDRSINLSGAHATGDFLHLLPVSYGSRSVVRCFDGTFDGEDPFLLFDLPPHCGFTGIEFESEGLDNANVGKTGDPNLFVDDHAVTAGLSYAPSLQIGTQSATEYTPVYLLGAAGSAFKVRCVYEVRGLPTVPVVIPELPITVTVTATPDVIDMLEVSLLVAVVVNGDGVSGVTWSVLSGPGTLSDITPFTATYTAPAVGSDSLAMIRAVSVEDPSKMADTPISILFVPEEEEGEVTSITATAVPDFIILDGVGGTTPAGGVSLVTGAIFGTGVFDPSLSFAIVGGSGVLSMNTVYSQFFDATGSATAIVRVSSVANPLIWDQVTITVFDFTAAPTTLEWPKLGGFGLGAAFWQSSGYPAGGVHNAGVIDCGFTVSIPSNYTFTTGTLPAWLELYPSVSPNSLRLNTEPWDFTAPTDFTVRCTSDDEPTVFVDRIITVVPAPQITSAAMTVGASVTAPAVGGGGSTDTVFGLYNPSVAVEIFEVEIVFTGSRLTPGWVSGLYQRFDNPAEGSGYPHPGGPDTLLLQFEFTPDIDMEHGITGVPNSGTWEGTVEWVSATEMKWTGNVPVPKSWIDVVVWSTTVSFLQNPRSASEISTNTPRDIVVSGAEDFTVPANDAYFISGGGYPYLAAASFGSPISGVVSLTIKQRGPGTPDIGAFLELVQDSSVYNEVGSGFSMSGYPTGPSWGTFSAPTFVSLGAPDGSGYRIAEYEYTFTPDGAVTSWTPSPAFMAGEYIGVYVGIDLLPSGGGLTGYTIIITHQY